MGGWSSGADLEASLSGTYRKDDRPLVLGAGSLEAHAGSPSIVAVDAGRYNGWSLPESGGIERLGGFLDVPDSWSTFDIELWHTHASGATDDAAMFVNLLQPSAGTDLGGTDHDSGTVAVTAVGTAGALGITTISSGVAAVGGATLLGLGRNSGNDTLTSAFILIAVVLRKAS